MSKTQIKKKSRQQRRAQNMTLPIVALGGLLLVIAFFLFANKGETYAGGKPAIAVDQEKIDYGYVKFGENRQFKVKVTNTGDGLLRFSEKPRVEVLEGC